jgi:hypothetical protein
MSWWTGLVTYHTKEASNKQGYRLGIPAGPAALSVRPLVSLTTWPIGCNLHYENVVPSVDSFLKGQCYYSGAKMDFKIKTTVLSTGPRSWQHEGMLILVCLYPAGGHTSIKEI